MFKRLTKKLLKEETGFTLIELLVTIAILGVLFGIVTLTLTGVGSNAATTSHQAEAAVVQSAVDIWIASNPSSTLTARTTAAHVTGSEQFGAYLRLPPGSTQSACSYTWDSSGNVTQDSCP